MIGEKDFEKPVEKGKKVIRILCGCGNEIGTKEIEKEGSQPDETHRYCEECLAKITPELEELRRRSEAGAEKRRAEEDAENERIRNLAAKCNKESQEKTQE